MHVQHLDKGSLTAKNEEGRSNVATAMRHPRSVQGWQAGGPRVAAHVEAEHVVRIAFVFLSTGENNSLVLDRAGYRVQNSSVVV